MTDLLVRTSVESGDAHGCFLRAHKRCRAVCAGQSIECGGMEQGHEVGSLKMQAYLLRARTLPASFSLRKHFMQLFLDYLSDSRKRMQLCNDRKAVLDLNATLGIRR
ncbi:hypothetical protein FHR47_003552 [Xanthomonas arboricola]|uniref:hypothetical protein n=1 Tax=Xanthomonas cannabis TaxID=1885674 RepID=UPI001609637C|nr:hypothetical protein [Xanthomonas cannabis]MBB3803259.1 hypothetical protein [Xanthomonas cannabis]